MKKFYLLFLASFMLVHFNAKSQFVEDEQCIGGEGQDLYLFTFPTKDGGKLIGVNTNSTTGDFISYSNSNYTVAFIKLDKNNVIEWKTTFQDSLMSINGFQAFVCRVTEDEGVFIIHSFSDAGRILLLDKNGNIINRYGYMKLYGESTVIDTTNNFIYITQFTSDTIFYVRKLNYAFVQLWEKPFSFQGRIAELPCSNFISLLGFPEVVLIDQRIVANFTVLQYCLDNGTINHTIGSYLLDKDGNTIRVMDVPYISSDSYSDNQYIYSRTSRDYLFSFISGERQFRESRIYKYSLDSLQLVDSSIYRHGASGLPVLDLGDKFITLAVNENYDTQITDTLALFINNKFAPGYAMTIIDTGVNISPYLDFQNLLYYRLKDSSVLIFYQKKLEYRYCKLDKNFNIVYNRQLESNLGLDVSIFTNTDFGGDQESWMGKCLKLSENADHTAYFYPVFKVRDMLDINNQQKIYKIDLSTGNILYTYNNPEAKKVSYQYLEEAGSNRIFLINQFYTSSKCHLGNFDLSISNVVLDDNKIFGAAYIDYNNNNIYDGGDVLYNLAMLESSKGNKSVSNFMFGNLYTTNLTDTGAWTTKLNLNNFYFTVTPSSKITSHNDYNHSDTAVFAMHPAAIVHDLNINMVNTFVTRLGGSANYEITYSNNGTHPESGRVTVLLDPRLQFSSATPGINMQNGDTLIWDFTNLKAGEFRTIGINFFVPIPPALNTGDVLTSYAMVFNNFLTDFVPSDNKTLLQETILGAYDPNDKVSTSGEIITPTQIDNGEYITYVIRFQNVGTDTAFKVEVLDTLDNNLDWNTFQMVNASHNFSVQQVNNNVLKFSSNNIALPDSSVNEMASHGFIAYKIKPKSTLTQGASIKNTAHIYFDYNQPVKTSTVNTRVSVLTFSGNNSYKDAIRIFPNPSNGIFRLEFNGNYSSPLTISIVDINGRTVYIKKLQHNGSTDITIDTENLAEGVYALQLKTGKETLSTKILITK